MNSNLASSSGEWFQRHINEQDLTQTLPVRMWFWCKICKHANRILDLWIFHHYSTFIFVSRIFWYMQGVTDDSQSDHHEDEGYLEGACVRGHVDDQDEPDRNREHSEDRLVVGFPQHKHGYHVSDEYRPGLFKRNIWRLSTFRIFA